jgi:ADP-ribosylglycohydrolase
MGISIYETLAKYGEINQDFLALRFAQRYDVDPGRGYGHAAREILEDIGRGLHWAEAAGAVFKGQGSMGNGSAMRVGPVGGYFADQPIRAASQAELSAEVTHAHPEGKAGAVAIALAISYAWQVARGERPKSLAALCHYVLDTMPPGLTADGIRTAAKLPQATTSPNAAKVLGNGSRVTCVDTVPLCIWCAGRHLDSFEDAIYETVAAQGDVDTTCAIVGSIVAMSVGEIGLPRLWRDSREPLDIVL